MKLWTLLVAAVLAVPAFSQSITISPDVKASVTQFESMAASYQIDKVKHYTGKNERSLRNLCNKGHDSSWSGLTQAIGCDYYMQGVPVYDFSDYMPEFKACALQPTGWLCGSLLDGLLAHHMYDYALALLETGVTGDIHLSAARPVDAHNPGFGLYWVPQNRNLVLAQGANVIGFITDIGDEGAILKGICLARAGIRTTVPNPEPCSLAIQVGTTITSPEYAAAARSNVNNSNRVEAQQDAINNAPAQTSGLETLSNVLTGMAASTPTIQQTADRYSYNSPPRQAPSYNPAPSPSPSPSPSSTSSTTSAAPPFTVEHGPNQADCTNMTPQTSGRVDDNSDGWVAGFITNNSSVPLWVMYTFKVHGVPDNSMGNRGGAIIKPGQTYGGELQGFWSSNADHPGRIYWYAVPVSGQGVCQHTFTTTD